MGWDTIRLGVAWAGAQPRDEDALDPEFLQRLHAVLDVCDDNGGLGFRFQPPPNPPP